MMKALGMLSGGLDSQLAIRIMISQQIDVLAVHFFHRFGRIAEAGTWPDMINTPPSVDVMREAAVKAGADFLAVDFSQAFLDLINDPKHGRGSGFNPCLDCRIAMLRIARDLLSKHNADFVFTGEVLGQRPMSQHKQGLQMVAKRSELGGLLLRPLSARLLPPTVPEEKGWIDRSKLLDLQGRNRKPQFALAKDLGLEHYPQPAGGCFLTDPNISARFFVWFEDHNRIGPRELILFRLGRHFRLPGGAHVVVGRNEEENKLLSEIVGSTTRLEVSDHHGASVFFLSRSGEKDLVHAARLAARYSQSRQDNTVSISIFRESGTESIDVSPAENEFLQSHRIE